MDKDPGQARAGEFKSFELEFITTKAVPRMDKAKNDKTLESLSGTLWNLCLWEKDRAETIDTKASYLLGISSIVGAVIATGGDPGNITSSYLLWIGGISLGLFTITIVLSLIVLLGRKYGSFIDTDIFDSIVAYKDEEGDLFYFTDKDPYRCHLKDTSLQRWLIYRKHCDTNDSKYKWLLTAQITTVSAVLCLFVYLGLVLFCV